MRTDIFLIIANISLLIWFFGCIVTYRFGKLLLVEGMGIKSPEFIMLSLYVIGLSTNYIFDSFGKWILLSVLIFWLVVQFFCHWYYTIFGASEKKLKGYNECFKNTVRLVPASETRLIPDLYHMILHTLILLNIILTAIS